MDRDYVSEKSTFVRLQAATGADVTEDPFEILPTSKVGCRILTRWITRIAMTREGVAIMYDKGRVGMLIPVPHTRDEAFQILKSTPCGTDRALRTDVRQRLLNGEIVGVANGRKRSGPRGADAFMVPYPHTVILADWIADKVWKATALLPLPRKVKIHKLPR